MRSTGNFSPEWGYLAPAPSILRTMRVVLVATAVGATAGAGVVLSLVDHSTRDGEKVSLAAHAIVTSAQAAPLPAAPLPAAPLPAAPLSATAPATPVANAAPIAAAAPAVSEVKIAPANVTTVAAAPAAQMPAQNALQAVPQIQAATPQPDTAARSAQASDTPADSTRDASAVSVPPQPAVAALSDAPVAAAPAVADDAAGSSDQTMVAPQAIPAKKTKHHTVNGANGKDNSLGFGLALRHLFSARAGTSYYPNRGL